jgi:hypothetical protein
MSRVTAPSASCAQSWDSVTTRNDKNDEFSAGIRSRSGNINEPNQGLIKSMSSLRLSVGVAACTEVAGLKRTLESVIGQERAFDQIVVADDQSSQACTDFLKRFAGRVLVVPVPARLTAIQHWNCLAPHLTGDWISLLSQEDCARPNFAREVEQTVSVSASAAVLRAGWIRLRDNGRPGETYTLHSVRAVVKPAEALYEQRFGPKGSFSAAAIRRDIWERAGYFPEATPYLGDWAMWLLAGALGDTVRSREVIAEHRAEQRGTDDEARRKTSEIEEMYLIYQEILPRATEWAGLDASTWIAAASRKRFRDVAIAASNRFGTSLRGPLVSALRPWAASVEQEPLLERLEGGERIRDFNLARRMKPAIKRVISAVR